MAAERDDIRNLLLPQVQTQWEQDARALPTDMMYLLTSFKDNAETTDEEMVFLFFLSFKISLSDRHLQHEGHWYHRSYKIVPSHRGH